MALESRPSNLSELFELYYARYKPIYNEIQTYNEMPIEMLFELAAAWDHVSRHWHYNEAENEAVEKAAGHLKRAVFDANKLILKFTVDEYQSFRNKPIDTTLIDNGGFERDMLLLLEEIRKEATEARLEEGKANNGWDAAFLAWDRVHQKCVALKEDYIFSSKVDWAERKTTQFSWRRRAEGFVIGVLASSAVGAIFWFFGGP